MRHLYNFVLYHIRHAAAPHHQTFRNNLSRPLDSFTTHPKKLSQKTPGNWKTLEFLPISKSTSQKENRTLKNSKPSPTIQRKEKRLLLRQRQEYHRAQTLRASPPRAAPPHANPILNLDDKIGTHERVTGKTATAQSGRQRQEGSSAVEWDSYSHRHVRPSTSYPVAPLFRACLCGSVFFPGELSPNFYFF